MKATVVPVIIAALGTVREVCKNIRKETLKATFIQTAID